MENKTPSRTAILLIVALFLLGVAIGAIGTHALGERVWGARQEQHHDHDRIVRELTHQLELTPDQQKQLTAIIDETRAKYHALFEPLRPQQDQIRQQGREKIRAILTPDQRPKFEEFLRQLDEERKKQEAR
jgi:protein CpxP